MYRGACLIHNDTLLAFFIPTRETTIKNLKRPGRKSRISNNYCCESVKPLFNKGEHAIPCTLYSPFKYLNYFDLSTFTSLFYVKVSATV